MESKPHNESAFLLFRERLFVIARLSSAFVLAIAVALKLDALLTMKVITPGGFVAQVAIILVESCLIWWAVFAIKPRLLKWSSAFWWLCLASVSAYQSHLGGESCGCFGDVAVPPKWTTAVDLMFVGLFLGSRPTPPPAHSRKLLIFSSTTVVISVLALTAVSARSTYRQWAKTESREDSAYLPVQLDAISPGEPWSATILGSYVQPARDLEAGVWLILFYDNRCQKCRTVLKELRGVAELSPEIQVGGVLVENPITRFATAMPSSNLPSEMPSSFRRLTLQAPTGGRPDGAEKKWVIDVPSIVVLRDGTFWGAFDSVGEAIARAKSLPE